MPPSSSGLGRSPFKATTGVRIPVGAQIFQNSQRELPNDFVKYFVYLKVCSVGKSEYFDHP